MSWPACLGVEKGLAWFPYAIVKGAINVEFNQGGLVLGGNNVNNPRAPGDVPALDCGGISKFLSRAERRAPWLRMQTELGRGGAEEVQRLGHVV